MPASCSTRRLLKFGLAEGEYRADPDDGLQLKGAIILNAVKCLPPANKPEPREIATCRHYFEAALAALPKVRVVIALGQIAHVAAARALGLPPSSTKFGHGAESVAPDGRILLSSYHCSRYNQNTGRLDAAMFESVFERALELRMTAEIVATLPSRTSGAAVDCRYLRRARRSSSRRSCPAQARRDSFDGQSISRWPRLYAVFEAPNFASQSRRTVGVDIRTSECAAECLLDDCRRTHATIAVDRS